MLRPEVLAAGAALCVGAVAIALSGPPWTVPTVAAGIVALLLLLGALAMSRAFGDSGAGSVLGYAAVPYGFLAGLLGPAGMLEVVGRAPIETLD